MKSCIFCVEKHLGKSKVFFDEAVAGYPGRMTMCLGELAAAEEEAVEDYPDLANIVRDFRKKMEVRRISHSPDWESLFTVVESFISDSVTTDRKMSPLDASVDEEESPRQELLESQLRSLMSRAGYSDEEQQGFIDQAVDNKVIDNLTRMSTELDQESKVDTDLHPHPVSQRFEEFATEEHIKPSERETEVIIPKPPHHESATDEQGNARLDRVVKDEHQKQSIVIPPVRANIVPPGSDGCPECQKRRRMEEAANRKRQLDRSQLAKQPGVPEAHRRGKDEEPERDEESTIPRVVSNPATYPDEKPVGLARVIRDTMPGRVLHILTALSGFDSSYSLVPVIFDQVEAAIMAGYQVHLIVMTDATELPDRFTKYLVGGHLEVHRLIPLLGWIEDEDDISKVEVLKEVLMNYFGSAKGNVITHDIMLQTWYLSFAHAIHATAPGLKHLNWHHQIHSSLGGKPADEERRWRASLPKGHKLVSVNWSDAPHQSSYYQLDAKQLEVIPNARDARTFFGLSAETSDMVSLAQIQAADIVQVYPLSTPRADAKGLKKVIDIFAEMKKMGKRVCLIVANAHATGADAVKLLIQMTDYASNKGLYTLTEFMVTSHLFPLRAAPGMNARDVRDLFLLSNVFIFPSVSEACGLVMLEAAMTKNLLVLNSSVPNLADFIRHDQAIWYPFGGVRNPAPWTPEMVKKLASDIINAVDSNYVLSACHRVMRNHSLEALAKTMHQVFAGLEDGSEELEQEADELTRSRASYYLAG